MVNLSFRRLNTDWSAEPTAPHIELVPQGTTVRISFVLDPGACSAGSGEFATLRFVGCSRYWTNSAEDHAWYEGKELSSGQAPKWGEFYEVAGDTRVVEDGRWAVLSEDTPSSRQFLLPFQDDTFEFVAQDWSLARA